MSDGKRELISFLSLGASDEDTEKWAQAVVDEIKRRHPEMEQAPDGPGNPTELPQPFSVRQPDREDAMDDQGGSCLPLLNK